MWADAIFLLVEGVFDVWFRMVTWPGRKRGSDGRRLPYERVTTHKRAACGHVVRREAKYCPKCREPV